MTNFLVLKHVYSEIIVFILLIQLHHASNRPILNCSDKRITCLSDIAYRFCFNTTSSHIMYGRIKRCPKYTVCREDKGHWPCIKQEITNNTIMLPSFTTPIPLSLSTASPSRVIGNNGTINTHKPARIIVKTSSISTSQTISLNKHSMSKSTVAHKVNVTKKSHINSSVKPFTASVSTKVKKKTNKPNKLKLKKNKRKKDSLVNNIIKYFKIYKNKSPSKKATKIPKFPNYIKRMTKFPLKPTTKSTTKQPVVKISRKPSKKPTKKIKHGIASLKISKKGTKRPTNIGKPSTNTIILSVKQKTPSTTRLTTSIPAESSTFLSTTEPSSLITVPTSTTSATTASVTPILVQTTSTKTTSVTTSTTEKSISIQTTLKATTVDVKDNTTESSLTSTNNVDEQCNCSGILLNNNSYTSPPFPCEIFEKMFKLHATMPTTTISTVATTPSTKTCKSPAKYPGKQCYEYYECMKVMWWHQMFTKNCKNKESFNATLLTCQPDKNCTHG